MRLAHVRIAAVSLVSGGVLALGVLGGAQAAQVKPRATASTDTQCQALPVPATASPSPSPLPRPSFRDTTAPSSTPSSLPSPPESTSASPSPLTPPTGTPTPLVSSGGPSAGPSLQSRAAPLTGLPSSSGSSSPPRPPSPSAGVARASLDAYIAASPSPSLSSPSSTSPTGTASPSGTASPGASADATAQPQLCVSVQRSQASITRGRTATYIVRVSTRNTSAPDVSVSLTAQPTSQKATFTAGCTKGDGTAACAASSVSAKRPVVLHAQIAVASSATSIKSVKLTATASIATAQSWKAPTVAETTAVTSTSARSRKPPPLSPLPLPALPLGRIPDLNGVGSTFIQAGNATQLFPIITPSPVPSATPAAHPQPTKPRTRPVPDSRALSPGSPLLPARVAGLILLSLAIVLAITRLSLRRWPGSGNPRG